MPERNESKADAALAPLQVITLVLSVYVLAALFAQSAFSLSPDVDAMIDRIDFFVCMVFLIDFFVSLARAPSKRAYLRWGWIDFISSIPMIDAFRVGRLARIIRILRILRAFRSTKNLLNYLFRHRRSTSLAAVASISLVLMLFAAIAMLQFETLEDSNIKDAGDALWWSFVTITTVGYGDKFPVSVEGRIVAGILMAGGVGLFGTFTGFIASLFVEPQIKEDEPDLSKVLGEVRALRAEVAALRTAGDPQQSLRAAAFPDALRTPADGG